MTTQLTAADLFSGAGGASLGIVQSGYDLRFALEIEPNAARTHHEQFPGVVIDTDIQQLDSPSHRHHGAMIRLVGAARPEHYGGDTDEAWAIHRRTHSAS